MGDFSDEETERMLKAEFEVLVQANAFKDQFDQFVADSNLRRTIPRTCSLLMKLRH